MVAWLQMAFAASSPFWLTAMLPILWFGRLKIGKEEASGLINCIYLMIRNRRGKIKFRQITRLKNKHAMDR
ncbi:MAG: hypothetical protein HYX37_00230 [Rhizobiales bacterium]|nr:hypothetical protein [Hyphomicrobiales bacterium]